MSTNESYTLDVNGERRQVRDAWIGESLLYVLRERLGLPGAKGACEQGECGSCTVIMDGRAVCSCLVMAASATDASILTVESLGADGRLSDVQQAFLEEGGVQCGFCTPGFIVAVHHLLDQNPRRPTTRSKRHCRATSVAAPDTDASCRPCAPWPTSAEVVRHDRRQ